MTPLTPAIIMDLRSSIRHHAPTDATIAHGGIPFIIYIPSDNTFLLHAYGRAQAAHGDPGVLAQCMVCERAEPGFIRRILNPAENCELASLSPDLLAAERVRQASEARQAAEYAAAERTGRERRAGMLDVSKLSLEDL